MKRPTSRTGLLADALAGQILEHDGSLSVAAPAKINLSLQVGQIRPDGFHPLDSLVAKISFYDELMLLPVNSDGFSLTVTGPTAPAAGPDQDNLVTRASRGLADRFPGRGLGPTILRKHVPAGAGLGGGSSDAAAVLAGLCRRGGVETDDPSVLHLAAELGSDVPLFLGPSTCRMTGRGEVIAPADIPEFWMVLVLPPVACPTGKVYRAFDDATPTPRPPLAPEDLVGPPSRWTHLLFNDLAEPAMTVAPQLRGIRDRLSAAWAAPVHVTGSGSALFALADDPSSAQAMIAAAPADLRPLLGVATKNPW